MLTLYAGSDSSRLWFRYQFSNTGALKKISIHNSLDTEGSRIPYIFATASDFVLPASSNNMTGPFSYIITHGNTVYYANGIEQNTEIKTVLFCEYINPAPEVYSINLAAYDILCEKTVPPVAKMDDNVKKPGVLDIVPCLSLKPKREYTLTFDFSAKTLSVAENGDQPKVIDPYDYSNYLSGKFAFDLIEEFPALDKALPLYCESQVETYDPGFRFNLVSKIKNYAVLKPLENEFFNANFAYSLDQGQLDVDGQTAEEILRIHGELLRPEWIACLEERTLNIGTFQTFTKVCKDVPLALQNWLTLSENYGGLRRTRHLLRFYIQLFEYNTPEKVYADILHRLCDEPNTEFSLLHIILDLLNCYCEGAKP